MAEEGVDIKRLREHVRPVVVCRDVLDLDDAESLELSDFEEAPIGLSAGTVRGADETASRAGTWIEYLDFASRDLNRSTVPHRPCAPRPPAPWATLVGGGGLWTLSATRALTLTESQHYHMKEQGRPMHFFSSLSS